jgi:hypothetical protein
MLGVNLVGFARVAALAKRLKIAGVVLAAVAARHDVIGDQVLSGTAVTAGAIATQYEVTQRAMAWDAHLQATDDRGHLPRVATIVGPKTW